MLLASQPEIGARLQHFTLERRIGAGGMGSVWAARDDRSDTRVALKILHGAESTNEVSRARMLREAHAARSIPHPAIVPVIEVLEHEGNPVLVMDLLQGETLRERLLREPCLPLPVAAELLAPIAEALGAAHAAGIVHRDLKPENIFIESTPSSSATNGVRLLDFGVARFYEPPDGTGDAPLTAVGMLLGTLAYMAPEQALRPSDCDERVDAWALGVILYETLSGCRPIEGNTGPETMRQLLLGGITPLEVVAPGLPKPLVAAITSMLARSPDRRPRDLAMIAALLQSYAVRAR